MFRDKWNVSIKTKRSVKMYKPYRVAITFCIIVYGSIVKKKLSVPFVIPVRHPSAHCRDSATWMQMAVHPSATKSTTTSGRWHTNFKLAVSHIEISYRRCRHTWPLVNNPKLKITLRQFETLCLFFRMFFCTG